MRQLAAGFVVAMIGCAEAPPKPVERPAVARKAAPKPVDPVETAEKKAKALCEKHGVSADEVKWTSSRERFALVVTPKPPQAEQAGERAPKEIAPATARLIVYRGAGEGVAEHEVEGGQPPTELQFLGDDRLVYLVTPPPPAAPPPAAPKATRPAGKGKKRPRGKAGNAARAAAKAAPANEAPQPYYVIQPIASGAAPVRCDGDRYAWTDDRDHLAWVGGEPGREFVGADGTQVYPRSGRTTVQGKPAWSTDGKSLALIEITSAEPRLVVLVETDNPNGDNTWPLPETARRPDYRVFWAGPGQLVVGESLTKPAFATSFVREEPKGRR